VPSARDERWPLGARVIHWALALVLVLDLFVLEEGDPPHRYLGYVAVGLVVVRLLWGAYGSGVVAFANYPRSLPTVVYFLVWSTVLALGVTGFLMGLDVFWGNELLEDIHSVLSKLLMGWIGLHLAGVARDAIRFRRPTWKAMINGRRFP